MTEGGFNGRFNFKMRLKHSDHFEIKPNEQATFYCIYCIGNKCVSGPCKINKQEELKKKGSLCVSRFRCFLQKDLETNVNHNKNAAISSWKGCKFIYKITFPPILISYFLVKWNFVGQGERQLTLDIGDTVHIEEFCDGKKAIFIHVIIHLRYEAH